MNFHSTNFSPAVENVDALIQTVQAEAIQDFVLNRQLARTGHALQRNQLSNLRQQKIRHMMQSIRQSDVKKRLQAKFKQFALGKAVTYSDRKLQTGNQELQDVQNRSIRIQQRVDQILSDLDQSKAGAVNTTAMTQNGGSFTSSDISGAAKSIVSSLHSTQRQNLTTLNDEYRQIDESFDAAQNHVAEQQSILKKSGFFGKLFQVFYQTAMTAVGVFAAPLGPIAQKAIQGAVDVMMTSIGMGIEKKFQQDMSIQQTHEQNRSSEQSDVQQRMQEQKLFNQMQGQLEHNVLNDLEFSR